MTSKCLINRADLPSCKNKAESECTPFRSAASPSLATSSLVFLSQSSLPVAAQFFSKSIFIQVCHVAFVLFFFSNLIYPFPTSQKKKKKKKKKKKNNVNVNRRNVREITHPLFYPLPNKTRRNIPGPSLLCFLRLFLFSSLQTAPGACPHACHSRPSNFLGD